MLENIQNTINSFKRKQQSSKFFLFVSLISFMVLFTFMVSNTLKKKVEHIGYTLDWERGFSKHLDAMVQQLEVAEGRPADQLDPSGISVSVSDDYGIIDGKHIPRFGSSNLPTKTSYMRNKKKESKAAFKKRKKDKNKQINKKMTKTEEAKTYQEEMKFTLSQFWDEEKTRAEEQVLEQRNHKVTEVCRSVISTAYREPKLKDIADRMIWVPENQMVWCPIFKVASTTWVNSFLRMKGVIMTEGNTHGKARELYPHLNASDTERFLQQEPMRLIVVRHPLDRILSAYRDKMLRELKKTEDPYRDKQRQIYYTYKDPILPEGMNATDILPSLPEQPSFNQFLLRVRDDVKKYQDDLQVRGKAAINLHWRPYYGVCAPCTFNYTTIMKVETFQTDQEYIIRDRRLPPEHMLAKAHSSNFDNFSSTSEARLAYFSRVPRSLLSEIVQLLHMDFKLFDYSPDFHMNLTFED